MRRLVAVLAAVAATTALGVAGTGTAEAAVAPLTVTVNPAGTINPDNSVTVSGTVTCPGLPGQTFYGYAKVRQPGRVPNAAVATGLFFGPANPVSCTGEPQPWVVTTGPGSKPFVVGAAEVEASFATQGPAGLNSKVVYVPVTLA